MFRRLAVLFVSPLALLAAAAHAEDDAAVSAVVVTGSRAPGYVVDRIRTATRTDTALRDTPQSVTVIDEALIRDRSVQSLAEVLRYVPGAGMGQGEGHRDAPTLRGMSSTADFFVDGVRDDLQYYRDLYNAQRVEVLRGPNAMVFGRGGGGGVINRVTRKADGAPHATFAVELGEFDHRRATGDLGGPFTPELSGRIVGMVQRSGSYRDAVNLQRWGVNPSFTWRGADGLALTLSYEHFDDDRTIDRGIPSFLGRPSPAPRAAYFGDPDQSHADAVADVATLSVERRLGDRFVLRNRTAFGDYGKFYQNIYPGGPAIAGPSGAAAGISLAAYNTRTDRQNLFSQTDLVWTHGPAERRGTVLAGVELGRQETRNLRRTGRFGPAGALSLSGLPFAAPTLRGLDVRFAAASTDADNLATATVLALYLQDQRHLTKELQLLTGVRVDRFTLHLDDRRAGITGRRGFSRTDEVVSPRAGLIWRPVEALSLYGSYSVSFLPASGDQFASLTATTETLRPERFENLEVGAHWEPLSSLMVSAALYRLDRDRTSAPDPLRPGVTIQTGAQRSEGLELGVSGAVRPGWDIQGGYAWQSAEITRTTASAPKGRKAPLVPEHAYALWNRFRISDTVSAGLGVTGQSRTYASLSNAVILPAYARLDAALYLGRPGGTRLQVNVENLLDRAWFPTSHGDNNIQPGAPRTARVTISRAW